MRRTLASIAILLLLATTLSSAQAPNLVSVTVATSADDDATPLLYADQAGLFRKAGIKVDIQRLNGGAAVAAAVAGGAIDIGKSSMMPLITAHAHGVPFVLIAPSGLYLSTTPDGAMIVAANSPIHSAHDLDGKTISSANLRDANVIGAQMWIDKNGGDSSKVKFVELPPLSVPGALEENRIDAATVLNPVLTQLVKSGKARVLGDFFDAISNRFLQAAWFANADYAGKHHDIVLRFAAVMRDASAYCNAHHAETIPLIATFTGIDPATIATMVRPIWALTLDAKDIQPSIDAAAKGKLIDKGFDAHDLMASP